MDNNTTLLIVLFVIISIACPIIMLIKNSITKSYINETIDELANNTLEITPEEFMKLRSTKLSSSRYEGYYALKKNFAGIYILHNKTKDKYYVGQSKTVLNRVNNHFTGKGNGDVYFDYRSGDQFTIKMISLENSGFPDLDSLERNAIARYDAFNKGYNKTRGNN